MKTSKAKKLARKYFKWWIHSSGLGYGRTNLYFEEFIKDESGPDVVGLCKSDWRYQESHITLALHKLRNMDAEGIEEVVVHELIHIFLNEMREEGIDHEERVATNLQKAFMWIRDEVSKK